MEHVSGEKITVFKVRISPVFYVYFKFALLIFYLYLYNSRVYQPSWHISFILIGHTIHLETIPFTTQILEIRISATHEYTIHHPHSPICFQIPWPTVCTAPIF